MEFRDIAGQIDHLLREVDNVDVRVPEDSALISLVVDLVPVVIQLLEKGIALLNAIEERYGDIDAAEPDALDGDPHSLKGIGFLISSVFAARDLTDLAFFARTELKGCLKALQASTRRMQALEAVASTCEAGTRRLRKALVSVESALYEYEELEAPRRKWFDVEVSLQIRKLYWNLRQETVGRPISDDKRLAERMRSVVYRLVAFRELSVYPFLRIDDRIQLRGLLKRILEWLNSEARNAAEGRQLWQDLSSFAEILIQVSQRQELQDYDRSLIERAFGTLFKHIPRPAAVPPDLFFELENLLGLDEELDRLIIHRSLKPVETWREPLIRIQESLNRPEEPIPSVELWSE